MFALNLLAEGEGPDTALAWIFYLGLGFFLLMVLVGWLRSLRRPGQPGVHSEPGSAIGQGPQPTTSHVEH